MQKWLLLLSVVTIFTSSSMAQKSYKVGDTLPIFTSQTHEGAAFKLDTILPRTTLVVFWASWNTPSMQLLNEIKQQYAFVNPTRRGVLNQNVDVVDVCLDQRREVYNIVLKREDWPWETHLYDGLGWESDVVKALNLKIIPTIFLVNQYRKIIQMNPEVSQIRSMLTPFRSLQALSN